MVRGTILLVCSMAIFAALVADARAQCGALCLYENGSPELGRAAAGAGARAQDASTAFWNPAGMTELEGSQVLLGAGGTWAQLEPGLDSGTVTSDPTLRSGGDISSFAPFLGGYVATKGPGGLSMGMASGILYGGMVAYDTNWTGRGFVVDSSLLSYLLQPSFAYAVTDWLSLGAAVPVLYTTYTMRVKGTAAPGEPTVKIDGADGWTASGAFSALLKPSDGTRIGVSYRMRIRADTSGAFEGSAGVTPTIDTDFTFPQGVNVSLYQELGERWAALMDVGWTDWSKFGNIPIQLGPVGGAMERGWKDTWRIGGGAMFSPSERWTFQGGVSYDSAPVDMSRLLPDIPAGQQIRFATGIQYRPIDYLEISASYQFQWFAGLAFDDVPLPPSNAVVLSGDFQAAYANQAGVSVNVKF